MVFTTIDDFYLSDEQLQDTPSRRAGIDEATETQLRTYGCDLIQEAGVLLKLPQVVMATGQVLFHRFYCKKGMAQFNVKRVAMAATWLAAKLEEQPRRIRDVLSVFYRIDRRREGKALEPLDAYSRLYEEMKADMIQTERRMLRSFGFIMHVDHPHKLVLNFLQLLQAPAELYAEAWRLTNDSLRTTLCVRFKADVVACGVIFLAARRLKVPLPETPPWWELFGVDRLHMLQIAHTLIALYAQPKAQYVSVWRDPRGQRPAQPAGSALTTAPVPPPSPLSAAGGLAQGAGSGGGSGGGAAAGGAGGGAGGGGASVPASVRGPDAGGEEGRGGGGGDGGGGSAGGQAAGSEGQAASQAPAALKDTARSGQGGGGGGSAGGDGGGSARGEAPRNEEESGRQDAPSRGGRRRSRSRSRDRSRGRATGGGDDDRPVPRRERRRSRSRDRRRGRREEGDAAEAGGGGGGVRGDGRRWQREERGTGGGGRDDRGKDRGGGRDDRGRGGRDDRDRYRESDKRARR